MASETFHTTQVAAIIGVHPNTVRLYEALELIPKAERSANGYRVFTDQHIAVMRLARLAFEIEILQNGLRTQIISVVKAAAAGEFATAITLTDAYLAQVQTEQANAREAIRIVQQLLDGTGTADDLRLKRKEAAALLNISMDTLRNWELNGLLAVKRRENGYRVYTGEDIMRLKIIRTLRCANYSLSAILNMLCAISENPAADIERVLDMPSQTDDTIISVCDKLLTTLGLAEDNARRIRQMLCEMS